MEFRLQIEGIRCFEKKQEAMLRPLMLRVGENSSGKSTVLALYQAACSIVKRVVRSEPSAGVFNNPPFLPGAYEHIASHRGVRKRRASHSVSACRCWVAHTPSRFMRVS